MADVYATIAQADQELQERLAGVLELRAADPQQRTMLEEYTAELQLPEAAELLEVGCGTGAICRFLTTLPGVGHVTGVDPSPLFVERARELAGDLPADFATGDGRELEFDDESFDAVVFHTSLCHVPECERALAEAHRVLRPGGRLAVFDGDYATMTLAIDASDPLQSCAEAVLDMLVHDPWLMRRIAPLLDRAGFDDLRVRGHAYTSVAGTDYFLALVDRGADALGAGGTVRPGIAAALKDEARTRVEQGTFFGHISYVSVLARRG
jgi:ubiquinone/menaquinone biosynthesis C-methylase UbiE